MMKLGTLIECPGCKYSFEPDIHRKVTCMSSTCGLTFCKECFQDYHENGNCHDKFIANRIKDLEMLPDGKGNNFSIVSQCPKCRIPYIKDEKCDHVICLNPQCGVAFCFSGACVRSPTLEHGNHYHRPQCPFYAYYNGEDDKKKTELP